MLVELGISLDSVAAVIGHVGGSKETRTLVRHYVRTDLLDMKARTFKAWDKRLADILDMNSLRAVGGLN